MLVRAWQVPNLTPATRLVLLDLADCADHEGRNAYRSERTIAGYIQLDVRTVKRAIKELRRRHLICIQELPRQRRSTTYELSLGNFQRGQIVTSKKRSGVTLGVTNPHARGDKVHIPSLSDPVLDPVDPRLPALMTELQRILAQHPACSSEYLKARLFERFADQLDGDDRLVIHAIKKAKGWA